MQSDYGQRRVIEESNASQSLQMPRNITKPWIKLCQFLSDNPSRHFSFVDLFNSGQFDEYPVSLTSDLIASLERKGLIEIADHTHKQSKREYVLFQLTSKGLEALRSEIPSMEG